MSVAVHRQDVDATLPFIRKSEVYATEKAYGSDVFTPDIPRSNVKTDIIRGIRLTDIRPVRDTFKLNEHGFQIMDFETSMKRNDWINQDAVESLYCRELGIFMKQHLGASSIQVFEAQVRRRHSSFPHGLVRGDVGFQPAMRPHVDATREHTITKIHNLNGSAAEDLLKGRWIYFNVWKPLKGPLRDWPLALCDPASISPSKDLISIDNVIKGEHAENVGLHYNPNQEWMYLSDHVPTELLVFRQADSEGRTGVPHAAFDLTLPEGVTADPRESVEVRMIAYFRD